MQITGNIIDVIQQRIFKGELLISQDKIKKINVLKDKAEEGLPYILPGFIDAHVHIESSMVTPMYFANHVKKFGTLGVITDPHEISNVCGVEGFDYMYKEARNSPIDIYFGVPSCVPATPFETSGAEFNDKTIDHIFTNYETVALAEMMNFPGVINRFPNVIKKLEIAKQHRKRIDGHAPALRGDDLQVYINEGISTDHESFSLEEAREKIQKGMKIQIREGSAARNFKSLNQLISEFPDQVMFCTDDAHPDTLKTGHIDTIVKMAINEGHDLFNILKAATVNAVKHYNLNIGLLQEGDRADFIVVNNLEMFHVEQSWLKGKQIYSKGEKQVKIQSDNRVNNFNVDNIVKHHLKVRSANKPVKVIQAIDGELITKKMTTTLPVKNDELVPDVANDILKMTVVNRYKKQVDVKLGFINGFKLKKGALASSIAHDSHNVICVGTNDDDMEKAINSIINHKGGISISNGEHTSIVPLPVAGLMANKPVEEMAKQYLTLDKEVKKLGCTFQAPFMTLAFMSLLVIPSLKLGDKGLFDVDKFDFVSLYE